MSIDFWSNKTRAASDPSKVSGWWKSMRAFILVESAACGESRWWARKGGLPSSGENASEPFLCIPLGPGALPTLRPWMAYEPRRGWLTWARLRGQKSILVTRFEPFQWLSESRGRYSAETEPSDCAPGLLRYRSPREQCPRGDQECESGDSRHPFSHPVQRLILWMKGIQRVTPMVVSPLV